MARSRNIKPAFFKNPELGAQPFEARLTFIGIWTLADREGRLEDRPARIAAELFPYDRSISAADVDAWLTALADSPEKFIVRYTVAGIPFIQISNFTKHQSPHVKEQASRIPAPGTHQTSTGHGPDKHSPRQCAAPPDSLIPSSLNPDSLKGIAKGCGGGGRGDDAKSPPTEKVTTATPPSDIDAETRKERFGQLYRNHPYPGKRRDAEIAYATILDGAADQMSIATIISMAHAAWAAYWAGIGKAMYKPFLAEWLDDEKYLRRPPDKAGPQTTSEYPYAPKYHPPAPEGHE